MNQTTIPEQELRARNIHRLHISLRRPLDAVLVIGRVGHYSDAEIAQAIRAWMGERGLPEPEPLEPPTAVLVEYCSHQCPDADLRCQLATIDAPQTHTHMATDADGRSWAWLGLPGYGTFEVRGPVDAQRRGRQVIRQGDRTRS